MSRVSTEGICFFLPLSYPDSPRPSLLSKLFFFSPCSPVPYSAPGAPKFFCATGAYARDCTDTRSSIFHIYLFIFVPFDDKASIGVRRIVANWARYESTCRGVRLLDRLRTEDRKSCNSRGWQWRYDHLPEVAIYRWFGIIDNWPPRYPVSPGNSGSVDVAVAQSICAQRS